MYIMENVSKLKSKIMDSADELIKKKEIASEMMVASTNVLQGTISKISSPAIVYLAINVTILLNILFEGIDASVFTLKLLKVCIWGYCVNYICQEGIPYLAWLIVFVPYIVVILQMVGLIAFSKPQLHLFLSTEEQLFFKV